MRNTHILQLDELNSPEYRDEGKKSVEQAYDAETGEPTKTSEAQEILLNLILNLGGIRKEVWEYLITPRFQEPQAVASVGRLLCYAAPLEWMELSVEALSRMAGTMYVNEITEAYQSDIPFDEVKHIFEISDTVFEMCQRRREYCKKHEAVKRQHPDNMTGSFCLVQSVTLNTSNPELISNVVFFGIKKEDALFSDTFFFHISLSSLR